MSCKVYSTAIKKTPYYYNISKKIGTLMLSKWSREEVFVDAFDKNLIEIDSLQRRKEVINVIYNRLAQLDKFLLAQFLNADVSTSKFILVYAIAKSDALFFEFLFEVYRESLLGEKDYISLDDFDGFFNGKKENDATVLKWKDNTIKQLTTGYKNILINSGLGIKDVKNIQTVRPLIHPNIEEHIDMIGDKEYLKAILGA